MEYLELANKIPKAETYLVIGRSTLTQSDRRVEALLQGSQIL